MREITMNDCMLMVGVGIFWFYSLKKEKREELVQNVSWNVLNKYYTYKIKMTNMMLEYGILRQVEEESDFEEEEEEEEENNEDLEEKDKLEDCSEKDKNNLLNI